MLLLRILTLPIAMLVFAALYTMAIKAPQIVEISCLLFWMVLPIILVTKFARSVLK